MKGSSWGPCLENLTALYKAICYDHENLLKINEICARARNWCTDCIIDEVLTALPIFLRAVGYDDYAVGIFEEKFSCLINTTERDEHYQNDCIIDIDNDFVPDLTDNCVGIYNPMQNDWNNNGIGDACEDSDQDGIIDFFDNCVNIVNPNQEDSDNDYVGDICDNCPFIFNPDQDSAICEFIDILDSLSQAGCELDTNQINAIYNCITSVVQGPSDYPTFSGPATYDAVPYYNNWVVDNWNCRINYAFDQFGYQNGCSYWKDNPFPLPIDSSGVWTNYFTFFQYCTGNEEYSNGNMPNQMDESMILDCDCLFLYAQAYSNLNYYESLLACLPQNLIIGNQDCAGIKIIDVFGEFYSRYSFYLDRLNELELLCGF